MNGEANEWREGGEDGQPYKKPGSLTTDWGQMRCNPDRQTRLETLLQAKTKQNLSADRCRVVVLSVREAKRRRLKESDTAGWSRGRCVTRPVDKGCGLRRDAAQTENGTR